MSTQNVLITGVSAGLGYGLAQVYLEDDWEVFGVSRRQVSGLNSVKNFHHCAIDLNHFDEIEKKLPDLCQGVSFDLVILNAGILGEIKDLFETQMKDIQEIMNVNLWANKIILDTLMGSGLTFKQVVAMSSGAAVNGNRGWGGYSISKAALNMLVKLYSEERVQTHFTALAPGLIDTTMQDYLCGEVDSEKYMAIQKLQAARNTEGMPKPQDAAVRIKGIIPQLLVRKSGDFADIRALG